MTSISGTGAVPKPKTRKAAKKKAGVSEAVIQSQVESLLDNLGITYIRVPDAIYKAIFGSSTIRPHIKALISSFIKGLPDITILLTDGRYICVELKTAAGKLSQGQKTFEKLVGRSNYHVCRSVEEVVELLKKYGAL